VRILVTSILDLKRVGHNRLHSLLKYLAVNHQITALCLNAWWLDRGVDSRTDYGEDPYFEELTQRVQVKYLYEARVSPVVQELLSAQRVGGIWRALNGHRFDVHLNYCNLLAGYVVSRYARRSRIPTVFDVADDLPKGMLVSPQIPWSLRRLAVLVARWLQRRNARIATRVTVSSDALRRSPDFPTNKTVLVPNGVDTQMFVEQSTTQVRRQFDLEGCFVLGFVGALREWVDFEPVFAALASLRVHYPDLRLLIVGEGRLKETKQAAAEHGVAGQVIFTGKVPYSQVPLYISAVDACLIPFRPIAIAEGALPLKLLEYMACRRPVISTPLAGVTGAVGEQVLYAADEKQWIEGIVELHRDSALRARMGVEGMRFVQGRHSWSKICQQFEAVLLEAASSSAEPSSEER
jgi:glycosyltransferase involved in cell wall biosynthesis